MLRPPQAAKRYRLISARDQAWSQVQLWAYALGAPYHVQQGLPLDALPRASTALRESMAAMCKRDWSIEGADDLVQTLGWLATEGHRHQHQFRIRQYCLMRRPAVAARREELREAGQEQPAALAELWRLDAVQSDWHGARGGVLLGFDAARAVMLVRCGQMLNWLPDAAAWRYLTALAADVRRSFASWDEYAADFSLSRAWWKGDGARDTFDDIVDQLLADKSSPWRTLPWDITGLEIPRPVDHGVDGAPSWSLEH
jgi:hypothetical protein